MKHVLFAFLISICVMSITANGKKYFFEGESVAVEHCESPDSGESDSATDYTLFAHSSSHGIAFYARDSYLINQYRYLSKPFSPIELDYFSPPPNCSAFIQS